MSRVGKYPIAIPEGVALSVDGNLVSAKGKLGSLDFPFVSSEVRVLVEDGQVRVSPLSQTKNARMMWGTTRARISNMVKGVSQGFSKSMEIVGVGYKASVQGQSLRLSLGFSHEVVISIPDGVQITTPQPTLIEVKGLDKQVVGQVAAEIRAHRPPEPYKGKGVKYVGERILRKEGKKK